MNTAHAAKLGADDIEIGSGTTFPLHIYNAPGETLGVIHDRFTAANRDRHGWWQDLIPYFIKYDIRCREVDAYVCEYVPRFKEALEKDPRRGEHEEVEYEELETALRTLDVVPDTEVDILFESFNSDLSRARQLFNNCELSSIEQIISALDRARSKQGKVLVVPTTEPLLQAFHFLADEGLVLINDAVPLEERLGTLKVAELEELGRNLGTKLPPRKPEILRALCANARTPEAVDGYTGDKAYIKAHPEESGPAELIGLIDLLAGHARVMAELVGRTFESAITNSLRCDMRDLDSFIVAWEIMIIDDERCCRLCRTAGKQRYPGTHPPRVPLHLACRCLLSPVTRIEKG